jgi:hypothetical protein
MGRVADVLPSYGYRKVSGFWVRSDSPYILKGVQVPAAPADGDLDAPADQ